MGPFTPIQTRILKVLDDGLCHTQEEMKLAVDPTGQADMTNVGFHLTTLRKILNPAGHDIIAQWVRRRPMYRHVILLQASVLD